MKDREKILRYFSATGEEAKDMAIRLLDIADSVTEAGHLPSAPLCLLLRRRSDRRLRLT